MDDWPIDDNPSIVEMFNKSILFNFVRIPSLLLVYPIQDDNVLSNFILNIAKLLFLILPLFLIYVFILPFIMLELLVYAIITIGNFYVRKIFSKNIYDESNSYVELITCIFYIFYFFISIFSYMNLYKYVGSTSINVLYLLVLIFFLYSYMSVFFLFFKIYDETSYVNLPSINRHKSKDIKIITEDLDKIYNADNYYSSSVLDKRLIVAYETVINMIKKQEFAKVILQKSPTSEEVDNDNFSYIDSLFYLLDQTADYKRIEDINLFKIRLLSYVEDYEVFLLFKDDLLKKSRIIYNINNEVIIDEIIKELGVKKTRKCIDDLVDFMNKHTSKQCADLYNKLLFVVKTKLLQS